VSEFNLEKLILLTANDTDRFSSRLFAMVQQLHVHGLILEEDGVVLR
jgi:hypothetical protein